MNSCHTARKDALKVSILRSRSTKNCIFCKHTLLWGSSASTAGTLGLPQPIKDGELTREPREEGHLWRSDLHGGADDGEPATQGGPKTTNPRPRRRRRRPGPRFPARTQGYPRPPAAAAMCTPAARPNDWASPHRCLSAGFSACRRVRGGRRTAADCSSGVFFDLSFRKNSSVLWSFPCILP